MLFILLVNSTVFIGFFLPSVFLASNLAIYIALKNLEVGVLKVASVLNPSGKLFQSLSLK